MPSLRYPRFLDVSDRQVEEAIAVCTVELVPASDDVLSAEDITRRLHYMQVLNHLRKRIPELLGF